MKKFYFLFVFLVTTICNAQIINFPDANFKNKLLQSDITNDIAQVLTPTSIYENLKIDVNNNGEIEVSEVQNIVWLKIDNANITSLTGIENFSSLILLDCQDNQLTTLDLSFRTSMSGVLCQNNLISTAIFPPIIDEGINISYNLIETLHLQAYYGFGQNTSFFILDCSNNLNLQSLYIKDTFIETIFSPNYFDPIYLSNCPSLSYICAKESDIPNIQSALNTNGNINCIVNSNCELSNNNFEFVDDFSINPNPAKAILNIQSKNTIEVASISIYNTLGQLVLEIPNAKGVSNIDVASLKTGNYFIKILSNKGVYSAKFIKE